MRTSATRPSSATNGRSASAPRAQLRPTDHGRACRTEYQNAFRRLAREGSAGEVDDRARQHDRDAEAGLLEDLFDREDGGLGVERVEDGLDQQDVGAAVEQAARRVCVGVPQALEPDIAGARIVHVRGERGGSVGRPERTRDPAGAAVLGFGCVGGVAGKPRRGLVHLACEVGEPIVGLADRVGVEGVRLDQVGARIEIAAVGCPR